MANLVSGSFKSTNVNDGADARLLMLETSGNVIGFDAEGKAVPGQKVDIVAYVQNIEGSPVFTAIPYIGETAQTPITLKGSGNARYITGEEWKKEWNRLIVSVSLAGFTDSTTIAKVQDGSGKDGQNAIVGLLTNEAITLSADENGNIPDFSTATGEFQIYDGLTKVTEGVSFAISGQVGASGTINQNGVYNVTAMTADTATIEFKASYKGTEIVKKLSLAKSRKGQPGKNANLLYLSVSNNVIVFDANDVAFPNQRISIVAKLQNISGTATFKAIPYINATAQPEIALSGSGNDRYISGENWDKRWTSLSVTATIGELSDQTTIYKISEVKGADGKNTIIGILTNESITISADANGNVPDFTKATGTFQIYDGIALVDPKNVTYAVQTQTGATATIGTNGVYKITAMSADTATVVFKATYGGVERTKQLSIAKSKTGQKGEAGNGIKSTKTQYQRSANGQTPPTGTWLDEIPVVPPGEFLWTRVTQTFDDNTTSVSYSVSKMGEDGEKGKDSYVHTMFANDIDFGNYDYSGNPNVMTKPYIAENITGGTTGVVVTPIDDGARIEKTLDVSRSFELALGNLLNNTDYIISYDLLVENGYVGDLKTCNIALEGQLDGKPNYIAVFYMNNVTSTDVWQKVSVKFNSGANMEKLSGFKFRVFLSQSVQVALKIKNVKIERGSTATPYQPNLLNAPYYLSKVALGENIITSQSYDNSNYLIGSFDINKTINNGDKLTITIQGTKPANKQFGMYIQTTTGAATEFQGHLTPVEGLTDVWSWSGGAKISQPTGSRAKVVIYQLPPESQVPNGKCTILWAKLEKSEVWTPNIDAFKYVGFYTGELAEAPSDPTMYKWNKIKGEDGENGKDGVSVQTITTTYQAGTSGTTPPTGAWLPTPPAVAENQFLWTKIEIALDDGTKSTGYSVGKMGAQGQPGEKGDQGAPGTAGNGIKSSSVTYQVSTSGTTTPTGTWLSTPPAVPQGQYLWTRTVLTFDNGQSVTAYAVSKAGIDGENGLNNDNMVFNSRFEKFNEWPQNSMGWYKTQFTQAIQPETDKPTNNILKIGGDASSGSRITFSRNIAVVPGTTIELSFDAKLSRLFTSKGIANIRMFDAEHANSSNQPDTVGGNSYINLYMDGTANAGAGVTEYEGKNTPITTANTWYRYKVRFLVPDNVTNVKMFFITTDPNASSFLFVRDPQGVIYKDLNANTRNFVLDSRFPSAMPIGTGGNKRSIFELSRPTTQGEKYTLAVTYTRVSGTLAGQLQFVLTDKNGTENYGSVLISTNGDKQRISGSINSSGTATHLMAYHGKEGQATDANFYEFEKIMLNLGDKTFDYEQAPEDGFATTNVWPNSSWNIGKGAWVFTDDQFEILEPETDKPESSILHGKPKNINFQQTYQMPHPRFVNAGDIIHVSFDYKEKNRTADTMLACVRIFPEKDTVNSSSNALMEKYITPSVLGWSLANNTNWINADYVFRSTVSGWLDILPYDNDATGNHESFYREIFVTNAGKLHGEWSPAQTDFALQIDGIPKVFVQANMPTDPSIKNGDQWWVQSGNKVTAIKVYGNGAWHDQAIDQAVLNIVQLNAVNINGSTISGGEILQQFSFKESDTVLSEGSTQFKDGYFKMDSFGYVVDSAGTKERQAYENHYLLQGSQMTYQTISYNATDDTKVDVQANSILSGGRLFMSETNYQTNEVYAGQLTAKALSNTGWKTFRLGPLFEVKEGNPPQYKIIHQLDGSKLVKFRGQFGLKSGNMRAGSTYYPFKAENNASSGENYVPAEITPDVTAFGYGATSTAEGGRLAATTARNILLFPASDTSYCSIEAFQYIIER